MIRKWFKNLRKKRRPKPRRDTSDKLLTVELARGKILLEVIHARYEMDKQIHERNHWKDYTI